MLGKTRNFTKFLKEYFINTNELIGVEVGVWRGSNALDIYEKLKPTMLILIDAWNETIEKGNATIIQNFEEDLIETGSTQAEHFLLTYRKFANQTNVVIIKGLSADVAKLLRGEFDFVYVDAGHGYEDVKRDIECWYPLVKNGGVFGGHDYHMEGVSKAVNEAFPNPTIASVDVYRGIDWWVIK